MPQALQTTLDFLVDLRFNNYKSWFDENRARYDQARGAVEDLVADIIRRFAPVEDLGKLTPKECLFRINRDVRFSKDKTPYKTHFGIVVGREGRKSTGRSYYLHVEPGDNAFIAAGVYDPTPEQLKDRQAIAANQTLIDHRRAGLWRYFGSVRATNSRPRNYAADHPAIDLLKHNSSSPAAGRRRPAARRFRRFTSYGMRREAVRVISTLYEPLMQVPSSECEFGVKE
jgi:uncharacterized protein (TIGR02453 family)